MYSKIFQYLWQQRAPEYRGKIFRYRAELERNQLLSVDQLHNLQWNRLRQLLEHAYKNVPFYKHRFDAAGLHPATIKTKEDFQCLPILTRQDLQLHLDDLVDTNCDRGELRRNATSGSTGNPTIFYQDVEHRTYHEAAKMRYRAWQGFEMGDKVAYIWGAPRDVAKRNWVARQRLRLVDRKLWLNAFDMTPEKMKTFAHQLIRWQPKYLICYVSSIYLFAGFLREHKLDRIRPAAIETSAEKLWDFQRELIEDVFQCPIIDAYGSREVPCVAVECHQNEGFDVFSDVCYLEVLKNGQPTKSDEIGEMVVTDLNNYAMPLIRYQNGDLARCAENASHNNRPFPRLKEIVGRSNTLISTPSGKYVHGAFLSYLLYSVSGVKSFQIHQVSLSNIDITVEGNQDLQEEAVIGLRQKIVEQLGLGVDISLKIVDNIPKTSTGKHRYIISDIPLPFVSNRNRDT